MSEKPKTKRQHYIPIFIIKNFCNESGKVMVYDKKGRKNFFATPKEIFAENYLYEERLTDDYFSRPNRIENDFASKESRWAALISQIIRNCDNKNNQNSFIATSSEKRELAEFAYNLFSRNPYNMEMMSGSLEKAGMHDLHHLLSKYGIGDDRHLCKQFDLKFMFDDVNLQENFCKFLLESYLYVGYTNNDDICLSNYPLIIQNLNNLYIAFLPLSSKYILIWSTQKIGKRSNILLPLKSNFTKWIKEYCMKNDAVKQIIMKQTENERT